MNQISNPVRRYDFDDKIQGKATYTADLWGENKLFVKIFRSDRQRAKILEIKVPPLPPGYQIINYQQIPGLNRVATVYDDQPFLAEDVVNYIGEPVLLIVGKDREIIKKIMAEIVVSYEDVKPINSIEESISHPQAYTFADGGSTIEYSFSRGNFPAMVDQAAQVFEDAFQTGYQEHLYLETNAFASRLEGETIIIYGSMQCPYYVMESMTRALGWDESRIRIIQQPTGGGFGGKEDYPSIPAVLCALAAIVTRQPVQLIYDREEDMVASTKRHPSMIAIKSHLDSNNKIIAMDIDIKLDGGAYASLSSVVLQRAMFSATGVYHIENLTVRGRVYATNKVVSSGFRGFGGLQAFFAIEMHLENIALALKLDPLQFKSRYFLRDTDLSCTQGSFLNPLKLEEMATSINESSAYCQKRKTNQKNRKKLRGIGFSVFAHGCGFTGAGEADVLKSKVKLKKYKDGSVEIFTASAEMGQGAQTTLAKIVASELEIPLEKVFHNYADTKYCFDSGPTAASRTVLIIGGILQECATEMKVRWDEEEFEVIKTYKYPEELAWDNDKFRGNAYPDYSWGTMVIEVEIDLTTYQVKVEKIWTEYDIGTAIDRKIVQGQIEGGIVQGLGLALLEEFTCINGQPWQKSLSTYIIPSAGDFPPPAIKLVENPRKNGPFGGGGLGELPTIGVAPALVSAIQNALGKKICQIPVTPELIREVLNEN